MNTIHVTSCCLHILHLITLAKPPKVITFCKTLKYITFCRKTLKYDTFWHTNLDEQKMAYLRCEQTPHFYPTLGQSLARVWQMDPFRRSGSLEVSELLVRASELFEVPEAPRRSLE